MPTGCRPAILTIPNEEGHIAAAGDYVRRLAAQMGFDAAEARAIGAALRRAVSALLKYSFEPGEPATVEVVAERAPGAIRLRVRDRGLPFGPCGPSDACEAPDPLSRGLARVFDRIRFENRGSEGKEIALEKALPDPELAGFAAACPLTPDPGEAAAPDAGAEEAPACRVRRLAPSEAHAIPQVVYRAYGYSYPHDYVYRPEQIAALIESGEAIGAAAVAEPDGRIVGYCALRRWEENPEIAELAQGVVAPQFRAQGCFSRMTAFLIDAAREAGLTALFGETVTLHPYSQRTALQYGFRDCGILIGTIPETTEFRGIRKPSGERGSMLLQHLALRPPPAAVVYPPPQHREMIAAIYANLGLDVGGLRRLHRAPDRAEGPTPGETRLGVRLSPAMGCARIRLDRCGPGAAEELRRRLAALRREKWAVIQLYASLAAPETARLCAELEAAGFFFAGLLPRGLDGDDALILQYLNNVAVDYDAIRTASSFGAELLEYIRRRDPDR